MALPGLLSARAVHEHRPREVLTTFETDCLFFVTIDTKTGLLGAFKKHDQHLIGAGEAERNKSWIGCPTPPGSLIFWQFEVGAVGPEYLRYLAETGNFVVPSGRDSKGVSTDPTPPELLPVFYQNASKMRPQVGSRSPKWTILSGFTTPLISP